MKKPKISVIMSAYNGQRYLKESIDSILSQTFKNFEFIIVDDGSTDSSLKIISEYAERDNRIKVIKNQNNMGLVKSLNKAIKAVRGEYIARQDADDFSEKDRLELQLKFLEKNSDIFLCGTGFFMIDGSSGLIGKISKAMGPSEVQKRLKKMNCICGSFMFRNDMQTFYREKFVYSHDYDLYLLMLGRGKRLANISDMLYYYRINPSSASQASGKAQQLFADKAREFYFERLKSGKDSYDRLDPGLLVRTGMAQKNFIPSQYIVIAGMLQTDKRLARKKILSIILKNRRITPRLLFYLLKTFIPGIGPGARRKTIFKTIRENAFSTSAFLFNSALRILSYLLNYLQIYALLRHNKRRQILVLMYHGVSEKNITSLENFDGKHVYKKLFERQIKYLKKCYNIISMDYYMACMQTNKRLPKNPAIITFDDGYRNNFTVLQPIITKYRMPVTIFLPVRQIGANTINSLTSIISFLISKTSKKSVRFKIIDNLHEYDLSVRRKSLSSIIRIRQQLGSLSSSESKKAIDELAKETGVSLPDNDDNLLLMSWDEVMQFDKLKPYISFGSHTLTHPDLTKLSQKEMKKELELSKNELERKFGRKINHLAYPFGYYNDAVIEASRKAGYSAAVTTEYGYNKTGSDPLRLKRVAVNNMGMAFFMLGLFFDLRRYLINTRGILSRIRNNTK